VKKEKNDLMEHVQGWGMHLRKDKVLDEKIIDSLWREPCPVSIEVECNLQESARVLVSQTAFEEIGHGTWILK
jgi:hypothetical protein